jgi:hypothetical protein
MWFAIGLLSLAGIAFLLARARWNVDWRGQASGPGRVKRFTNKGRLNLLRVGLQTPSELDFELKRETWFDRLAKSIGISQEPQLGNRSFDELVYVLGDDPRLVAKLRQDSALLPGLQRLVGLSAHGFVFKRLVCRRGQLWVDLRPVGKTPDEPAAIAWALEELQQLSSALPALPAYRQRSLDRRFLHTVIVLGISGGLALNAIVQLLRMVVSHFPFTVDTSQLWSYALLLAGAIVCALVFATLLLLGRSARLHLVLVEVLLFGSLGALGTAFVELRDFNMEADRGTPVELASTVLAKRVSHGKSNSYFLDLADWTGAGGSRRIEVSPSDFDLYTVDMQVRVRQWPGALGVRWVERIDPR